MSIMISPFPYQGDYIPLIKEIITPIMTGVKTGGYDP